MAFDWLKEYDTGGKPEITIPELPQPDFKAPGQYETSDTNPRAGFQEADVYPNAVRRESIQMPDMPMGDQKANVYFGDTQSKPGAVFPENISIPLTGFWDAFNHPSQGLQTLAGNLKLLPGNPVGEALGAAGKALEGTPVSGALEFVKNVITSPFESFGYLFDPSRVDEARAKGSLDITNPDFWNDPFAHLRTNVFNASGQIGAGADLVSTALTFGAGSLLKQAGKEAAKKIGEGVSLNMLEKIASSGVAESVGGVWRGLTKPFEGITKEGIRDNALKEWFLNPVVKPMIEDAAKPETVEALTRIGMRTALTGTLLGGIEGAAIEKLSPDSWAAQNIARNQVVPKDSPWGVAMDVGLSLGLDIFQLGGMVKNSAAKAALAEKMFGPIQTHLDTFYEGWRDAIKNNPTIRPALEWAFNKAIQDAAFYELADGANSAVLTKARESEVPLEQIFAANRANQLGFKTQQGFDDAVKRVISDWKDREGWQGVYKRAREVMDGASEQTSYETNAKGQKIAFTTRIARPGWDVAEGADTATRLNNLEDFYNLNKYLKNSPIGDELAGRMLNIGTDLSKQVAGAVGWLGKNTEWDSGTISDFIARFPKVAEWFDSAEKPITSFSRLDLMDSIQHAGIVLHGSEDYQGALYRMGELTSTYDKVRRQIATAGADASPQLLRNRDRLGRLMDSLRDKSVNEMLQNIEALQTALKTRQAELADAVGVGAADEIGARQEIAKLEGLIKDATENAFDMSTFGTRWEMGFRPKGPLNELFRESNFKGLTTAERNSAGKLFDKLFGGIENRTIGIKAYKFMADIASEAGVRRSEWRQVFEDAAAYVENGKKRFHGMEWGMYRSVWDLPPGIFKNIVERRLGDVVPKGYKDWGEVLYRAHPGPLRVFQESLFGKELKQMPYNETFHLLTRSMYPIVKFSLSPRFVLMNLFDQDFYKSFLGGVRSVTGKDAEAMRAIAESQMASDFQMDIATFRSVEKRLTDIVNLAAGRVPANQMDAVVNVIQSSPIHKEMLTEYGIKSKPQLIKFLEKLASDRDAALTNQHISTPAEQKLARDIAKHQENIDAGLTQGEWAKEEVLRDGKQRKLDEMRERRIVGEAAKKASKTVNVPVDLEQEAAAAGRKTQAQIDTIRQQLTDISQREIRATGATSQETLQKIDALNKEVPFTGSGKTVEMAVSDERFRPFLEAMTQARIDAVTWSRRIIMGSPDRSATERLMNSFLLYWPLSYQIKATKALAGFMLDRGFGLETNAAPATIASKVRAWHDEKIQNDPEYKKHFDKNKQLTFLVKNIFPATPDEVGVTLGPLFRLPIQVARGYKTPQKAQQSLVESSIGAVRDANMFGQIFAEQLKDGGLLHDFMKIIADARKEQ